MLDQLDALADDGKLDTGSTRKVRWFRQQVEVAESDARLDELTATWQQTRIRRRRWWHGDQAAELDGTADDYDTDDGGPLAITGPAGASDVDYTAEISARVWVLTPHGPGVCHIVGHSWDGALDPCARRADHVIPGGAICGHHHNALTNPLNRRTA